MPFEDEIAALNQAYFFREFTYTNPTFRYRAGNNVEHEVELADSLLWLGDSLIIYQLKERILQGKTTPDQERTWYERKVLTKGTKQVRDTLGYIQSHLTIPLENHRADQFNLSRASIENIHKLVVFKPDNNLPGELARKKYHESNTAGVIHIIRSNDYLGIIRTLLTPAEFMDYLTHRQSLIAVWGDHVNELPEQALVGHYISGNMLDRPEITHAAFLEQINHDIETWDVSGIISLFADRIIGMSGGAMPTDYYKILTALAELRRDELVEFKSRYLLALEKARANEAVQPYRMATMRTGYGFVFVPLTDQDAPQRNEILLSLTGAHKYELRLEKCIGMIFLADGPEHYLVDWCHAEYPWEHVPEIEEELRENNPFREVREQEMPRYPLQDKQ